MKANCVHLGISEQIASWDRHSLHSALEDKNLRTLGTGEGHTACSSNSEVFSFSCTLKAALAVPGVHAGMLTFILLFSRLYNTLVEES